MKFTSACVKQTIKERNVLFVMLEAISVINASLEGNVFKVITTIPMISLVFVRPVVMGIAANSTSTHLGSPSIHFLLIFRLK
jgi:hypothetical protein